jgi:hypothetical protein
MIYMCEWCKQEAHPGACDLSPQESHRLALENFWAEWQSHVTGK